MIVLRLPDKRASIEVISAKITVLDAPVPQTAAKLIRLICEVWTQITVEVKKVSCKREGCLVGNGSLVARKSIVDVSIQCVAVLGSLLAT
jgi:hypothetical protein